MDLVEQVREDIQEFRRFGRVPAGDDLVRFDRNIY